MKENKPYLVRSKNVKVKIHDENTIVVLAHKKRYLVKAEKTSKQMVDEIFYFVQRNGYDAEEVKAIVNEFKTEVNEVQ